MFKHKKKTKHKTKHKKAFSPAQTSKSESEAILYFVLSQCFITLVYCFLHRSNIYIQYSQTQVLRWKNSLFKEQNI